MNKNNIFLLIGVAILIAGLGWVYYAQQRQEQQVSPQPVSQTEEATTAADLNEKRVELSLESRTLFPSQVTVSQGDEVVLILISDEAGEFHIHGGYDIRNEVEANNPKEIRLTAQTAGRHAFEFHPEGEEEDLEVGALVVNPL